MPSTEQTLKGHLLNDTMTEIQELSSYEVLENASRGKNDRRPPSIGRSELLYKVADAGTQVCVKSFGSTGERASDPEGRVRTCRVRESGRSWRKHRGEMNGNLHDEEKLPKNRGVEYL